jgi:predicted ATPase/DNA-binding NarL/FixJ family response regulator
VGGGPGGFGHQVRDALAHLYDPVALQTHPLARLLGAPPSGAPAGETRRVLDGRLLRQRLLDAIAHLRPEGKAGEAAAGALRRHRLLELRYVEALDPPAVQAQLGISSAQYYRDHARALGAVVALLAQRWPAPPAAEAGDGAEAGPEPSRPTARETPEGAGRPAGQASPGQRLPRPLTSFVGRERELAAVAALLGAHRLVTLTGVGGCGKTRLALEAAAAAREDFADGVWLVELAAVDDPALVPQAVAAALGVREAPGRPLVESLRAFLQDRVALLVLDNCEHLLSGAAPLVADLLAAALGLRVLATGRAPLRVTGEQECPLNPLALPAPAGAAGAGRADEVARVAGSEAGRLFVERARAVRPDFALTAGDAGAVGEVCVRLDGLPLAIELAAARVKVLPPAALLARLDRPFALLTGGARDRPARHQTLRAALAWSHALLSPGERVLFRRLAVFAGGCTLESAAAVAGGEGDGDVLEGVAALVDSSLLRRDEPVAGAVGEPRYRMLETVREFAAERLESSGEAPERRRRHAAYFLALAEGVDTGLRGPARAAWVARLGAEDDNFRRALRWTQGAEAGSAAPGLRLAAALCQFWVYRGRQREGREWVEAALARPGAEARTAARAAALCVAGSFAAELGHSTAARARLEASVALWRELGDARGLARALAWLGLNTLARDRAAGRALLEEAIALARSAGARWELALALRFLGNLEDRRPAGPGGAAARPAPLEESAALFRELGDAVGLGVALTGLGGRAFREGDYAAARASLEEALAHRREGGETLGVAFVLNNLGAVARAQGDLHEAAAYCEESRALAQETGNTALVADSLAHLGHIAQVEGDSDRAAALLVESLRLLLQRGQAEDAAPRARCLAGLAAVGAARGHPARAVRLGGAAAALAAAPGGPLHPADRAALDGGLAVARRALASDAWAAAWAEGLTMTLEQAAADALGEAPEGPAGSGRSGTPPVPGPLSARQQEVADLIARGLTNRQIAERLAVSPHTVERHVEHILKRLGLSSRTQVAAWAARRGQTPRLSAGCPCRTGRSHPCPP